MSSTKPISSFNPRTPCGVRLPVSLSSISPTMFQSTHSLRSATDYLHRTYLAVGVSIHALLAECDPPLLNMIWLFSRFNPRTPCGVRLIVNNMGITFNGFQSTHSLRSATLFNELAIAVAVFQSTHSLRSATRVLAQVQVNSEVSIHALLAECDPTWDRWLNLNRGFNPRTPCGVRLTVPLIWN